MDWKEWEAISDDSHRNLPGTSAIAPVAGASLRPGNPETATPSYEPDARRTNASSSPTQQQHNPEHDIEGSSRQPGPYYQQIFTRGSRPGQGSSEILRHHVPSEFEIAHDQTIPPNLYLLSGENDVRPSGRTVPGYFPVQPQCSSSTLQEPVLERAFSWPAEAQTQPTRAANSRQSSPAFSARGKDTCECSFQNKSGACGKRFKRNEYNQGRYCNKHMAKVKKEELAQHPPMWRRDGRLGQVSTEELSSALFPEIPPMVYEGKGCDDWQIHELREEDWIERLIQAANTEYTGNYDETAEQGLDEQERQNKARIRANARKQQIDYNHKPLEESSKAWYTNDWVNRRFRLMFRSVLVFHKGGRLIYPVGGSNNGYGENRKLKMSERLSFIERVFMNDKRVVMDMIEGRGVTALVVNPTRFAERKDSNNKCNQNKKRKAQDLDVDESKGNVLGPSGHEDGDGESDYAPTAPPPASRRRRNNKRPAKQQQPASTSRVTRSATMPVSIPQQQPSLGDLDAADQRLPQDYDSGTNTNLENSWQSLVPPFESAYHEQQCEEESYGMPLYADLWAQQQHSFDPQPTMHIVHPTPSNQVQSGAQTQQSYVHAIDPALLSRTATGLMPQATATTASQCHATSHYGSTPAFVKALHDNKPAFSENIPSSQATGTNTATPQAQHSSGAPLFNSSGPPTQAAADDAGGANESATSGVCDPTTPENIRQMLEILGELYDPSKDELYPWPPHDGHG